MGAFRVDRLKLLFGQDYPVSDAIAIRQPTIAEIVDYGEQAYFGLIGLLTAIPADLKSHLWDCGVDYETMSDFELFCVLAPSIGKDRTRILFGDDIDFEGVRLTHDLSGQVILRDPQSGLTIDPYVQHRLVSVLCEMHQISKVGKRDIAGTALTKRMLIQIDRDDRAIAARKPFVSIMHNTVSALCNSAGFKYNHREVLGLTLYQVLDSVARIQVITSSLALLQGSYSGFCDTSKIDASAFNWLRDIKTH